MISRDHRFTVLVLIAAYALNSAFGQQDQSRNPSPPKESSKYRIIFTAAGAGGAYTLGVFAGIAAYDDAIYAERKIWTLALACAAAGGVGGYFLGRAIDKRQARPSAPVITDNFDRGLLKAQLQLDGRPTPGTTSTQPGLGLAFCPAWESDTAACPRE